METLFIYLLKSSGLVTLFFLAYYFIAKETFSPVTVGFVGLITSAILPLLVSRRPFGWNPIPQQSTGRKFRWYSR
jgi:hypothetical protein